VLTVYAVCILFRLDMILLRFMIGLSNSNKYHSSPKEDAVVDCSSSNIPFFMSSF
jgi:hypothetical protein